MVLISLLLTGCSLSSSYTNQQNNISTVFKQTTTAFPIKVDSNLYTVLSPPGDQQFIHGIETPRGLIWNPIPLMDGNGSAVPSLITPFSLYLSPNNTKQLQTSSAEKILTLPLTENYPTGKFYVYLGDYFFSKNWVIYTVSHLLPGMAQGYKSELRGFNLDDKRDILLTNFDFAGGNFFSVASDNNLILFSQQLDSSNAFE